MNIIDQGIKLYWDEVSQEMHVECVSQHAVFFQSHCFNSDYNFAPHTVVKIPPGSSACVFRLETFTRAIQYNLRVEEYSYSRVYDMSTMCQVHQYFISSIPQLANTYNNNYRIYFHTIILVEKAHTINGKGIT